MILVMSMWYQLSLPKSWIIVIIGAIVSAISPTLTKLMKDMVLELYKKAKATPNTIDDIFVKLLADVLNVNLE